jgi:exocyst complex component 4
VRSLKTIKKQDMLDIGAVADLRAYLIGQESVRSFRCCLADVLIITNDDVQALRDILIDELHNHLYLKSFWCENRWAAYTVGQQSSESLGIIPSHLTVPVSSQSRVRRRATVFE